MRRLRGEEATQDTQANQASQASQSHPKRKRSRLVLPRPTATVTSVGTPAENTDEAEEEGPPPPHKKKSVSDSLTADQEQRLVDFYATHPLFYDQTLSDFKNKAKKDSLQHQIGKELGMTGKCSFYI